MSDAQDLYALDFGADRLKHYIQAHVNIYYNSSTGGYTDEGFLTATDGVWVELTKLSNERLLIPIQAIRLIKLIATAPNNIDSQTLLRPVDGTPTVPPHGRIP